MKARIQYGRQDTVKDRIGYDNIGQRRTRKREAERVKVYGNGSPGFTHRQKRRGEKQSRGG